MCAASIIPIERINAAIHTIREQRVMLDEDLGELYGVEVKYLLKAVRRNSDRFPDDFMFQLTSQESADLRVRIGTSRSHGGRRYLPYAFTEQGVAMLSSVLRSPRAVNVNIEIMRAFVRIRRFVLSHDDINRRVDALEKKYDGSFKAVFQALRKLMEPEKPTRTVGFARKKIG